MNRLWLLLFLGSSLEAFRCPGPEWAPRQGTSDCFYIDRPDVNPALSWEDARTECNVRGGYLADIQGTDDLDYLKSRMQSVPSLYRHDFWMSLSYATGQWMWADSNRPFVVGDLGTFNPNTVSTFLGSPESTRRNMRGFLGYDDQGRLGIGLDYPSGFFRTNNNFICKANYSSRPLCKTEDGWDFSNGRCWMNQEVLSTWDNAKQTCLAEGGYIAVPSSDSENRRLNRWAGRLNVADAWIGINFNKTAATTANDVLWEDGAGLLNTNYTSPWSTTDLAGLVNNAATGRYCGNFKYSRLSSAKPTWSFESNCYDKKAFACETELEKCPYGWDHLGDYCYWIRGGDDELKNWGGAVVECAFTGGHLAVITK
jgi:hypothetical protein